ncbi:LamG-like jellyroll fold domain-containing protein, partial [Mariniflexile sp. AS56]
MKTKLHTTSLFPLLLFFFTLFSYAQTPPSGKALDFGGPTDYIALGNLGSVNNWTIETWFKPNGTTNYQNIFDSNDILNGGSEIRMELSSNWPLGRLYVYGTSGAYSIVPNGEILSDDWHHVVVISNQSAGKFIIYLDGIKKVDASPTAFATTFPNFVIGRGFSAGADRNYQGKIDEFRIWDKPLTEAEVLSNKNKCNLTGQENNLLAYYNFNQGVPNGSNLGTSTLNDLSPNNFNGTLYGFTLTGDSSNWIAEGICNVCPKNIVTNNDPNECGAIVNFPLASTGTPNAITSYAPASGSLFPIGETTVTATTTDSSGSSECTFTVTVTVNNTEAPIISCPINIIVNNTPGICGAKNVSLGIPTITNGCVTTGNALDFGGIGNGLKIPDFTDVLLENEQASISGWIYPRLQNPSFPPELDFIKDVFKVNTWQHLALSFDGTILKVYHNGILVGTIVPNISALIAANYDLATFTATIDFNQLLNDYFPLGLGGILDEVHVWNVARTQEQIQKEMNSEIEAQPGLIALYHFNEGIAGGNNAGVTTIKDDSGNGYDITLINFTLNGPTSNWVEGKSFNGVTFTNNAPTTYNTPIAYNYNNQLTANWTGTNTTIYPVGETIITWTAKDAAGNITTCTQTVTVELEQLVWSGAINTDWTNNGNWVNNVSPGLSPTSNISIPSGATNFPVITPSQTLILDSCYGITIATGAALTFNPNSVIINNSTVTNYGSLTFQSDITGSASIGAGIGTFVGDATIERYVSAKRAFRLLSSPVTTSTFISNNWQLGTHITGSLTNANGFDATGTGNPSMYSFDNISQSWNALPNTNATNL